MKLARLQRALQDHVLRGENTIARVVPGTERFGTATRLAVYAEGYTERLIEALTQSFPALRQALGESRFGESVRRLARERPSRHFSVRFYGVELAELLERRLAGALGRGAADLARFEWALAGAFDAPDDAPVGAEALQRVPPSRWAQLRLRLSPTLRVVELHSNAVEWWKAACEAGQRPRRWRRARAMRWRIWRRELAVYFRPLQPDEAEALAAIADGATFGNACRLIGEHSGAPAQRAATLLRGWIDDGLISAVVLARRSGVSSSDGSAPRAGRRGARPMRAPRARRAG